MKQLSSRETVLLKSKVHVSSFPSLLSNVSLYSELVNYFIELNTGAIVSEIFVNNKLIKERAALLKKLNNLTQELERAEEEVTLPPHNNFNLTYYLKVKAALHEDALKEDKDAQRALGLMVERTKKVSSDEPSRFERA